MSKTTGVYATYKHVSELKDGTTFTQSYMHKRLPAYTASSVNNALYKMELAGGLTRSSTGGYKVNLTALKKWGDKKVWKTYYSDRTGKRGKAKAKPPTDNEIMGNLIAAIAAAEPIIHKYQKIAESLKDLG